MSDSSLENRVKNLEQQLVQNIEISEQLVEVFSDTIDEIHSDINTIWRESSSDYMSGVGPKSTTFSSKLSGQIRDLFTSLDNLKKEIQSH